MTLDYEEKEKLPLWYSITDEICNDQILKLRECVNEYDIYSPTEKKKIYILGKMTSEIDHGFKRFFDAEKRLTEMGFCVLNPARNPLGLKAREYLQIDLQFVFSSDAVYRLNGWLDSPGAILENALAVFLELEVYDE